VSSTHRGYSRHVSDYYITPQEPIRAFLDHFMQDETARPDYIKIIDRPDKAMWLDPCAGGDSGHPMSYPAVIREAFEPEVLDSMDIRDDSPALIKGDYLELSGHGYDIVITNPPFYLAKEIIEKALAEVNRGGYVIMLLRLNFLGSNGRLAFWQKHPAKKIYVHHRRMSFTANGKTDSIEYAHFVWQQGYEGPTELEVI
jgi:hypothetical protein